MEITYDVKIRVECRGCGKTDVSELLTHQIADVHVLGMPRGFVSLFDFRFELCTACASTARLVVNGREFALPAR